MTTQEKIERLKYQQEEAACLGDWEQVNKLQKHINALEQQLQEENTDADE